MAGKINAMLAAVLLVGAASAADAASFDCTRARAPDERAICADRGLNDQDVTMSVMLKIGGHFVGMGARGAMQDDQIAWLKARRACGANRECLTQSYDGRIATLQKVIDAAASHGPF